MNERVAHLSLLIPPGCLELFMLLPLLLGRLGSPAWATSPGHMFPFLGGLCCASLESVIVALCVSLSTFFS
jgi:hypothetical protein